MQYLYNPVTDQLDDIETPKLGEKYFASAESDEIIKLINEQHGPGTMFAASEAPQPQNPYKDFSDRNPAAEGIQIRQDFGTGSVTPVTKLTKFIPDNKIKLFNEGGLYHLNIGGGDTKTSHYGTKTDLDIILKNKPSPGGNRRLNLNLENKKYPKGYLTSAQFIKFIKNKGIEMGLRRNLSTFSKTYGINMKPNPFMANDYIYDTSQFKDKNFSKGIIKRQVRAGKGTVKQGFQFRKWDNKSVMQRYFQNLRKNMQLKYSNPRFERILKASAESGLNLSHMDDLHSQYVTTRNLGYVPSSFNQLDLDKFDKKFREIYKDRDELFKSKPKGWEKKVAQLNRDGITLAKASDGYKQFTYKNVDGKTRVVGFDLSKTIDPEDVL